MADVTIDSLNVEIAASADSSTKSLNSLIQTIDNLHNSLGKGITKLSSFSKEMKSMAQNLSGSKIGDFGFKQLSQDLEPLTKKLSIVKNSMKNLPKDINKASSALKKMGQNSKQTNKIMSFFDKASGLINFGKIAIGFNIAKNALSGFIKESNSYVENMNLFRVSLGEMADEAQNFVDKFTQVLGVNPSNVMRYLGLFNNLIEGFGLGSKEAYIMSKNLTQLSYDMSSFLNIPVEQAMQKIKSGISRRNRAYESCRCSFR